VLVAADHYLPGFRAGGTVRALSNLVEQLGSEYEFLIVTRDRDLGSTSPYPNITPGSWSVVGNAWVYHARPQELTPVAFARLLASTGADLLYLNSLFSPRMTVLPLFLYRLGRLPAWPIVLAPRGECSSGALALKHWRKSAWLGAARTLGLLRRLYWQATNEEERERIVSVTGASANCVHVAPDLPPARLYVPAAQPSGGEIGRAPSPLQVVFLSRVSPMKNLDQLLLLLRRVMQPVSLMVYGPIGDAAYWRRCLALAAALPAHVRMQYLGEVPPDRVCEAFGQHDLFVFPTRGENFGHVILESLSAGTPIIVSDQTPWRSTPAGGLTVLPLEASARWVEAIDDFARATIEERQQRRAAARLAAQEYINSSPALSLHRQMFGVALHGTPSVP
jgi:glycosyltransferase involved in cell wall biosynthesis